METQQTAFVESPSINRLTDNFREKISGIQTAKDLVADRQLLQVALGAFGLDEDIGNKFFIEKILSDGTTADDALSSKLADKSYASLSAAFGFGDPTGAKTGLTNFADDIISRYETKQFEIAVGDQNPDLRLALGLEESLRDVTSQSQNTNAQWFSMMGTPTLRNVFETALGLPASLASIDLDQQLGSFKDRAKTVFGTDQLADFGTAEKREELVRLFLVRSQSNEVSGLSSGNIALSLLRSR